MIATKAMQTAKQNDAQLVVGSLGGNRDAFRQIVERYQTLISSLAYCATGDLSQSEDLAQETFVTAWKKLPELREPAKLRPWLCGIVRFLISREFRRQSHEPAHNAAKLDAAHDAPAAGASPAEQAISREEEVILWRALSQMPDEYREPLVLFYRDRQSIARVAEALELSEDAVKQRLSRGRKMLQEEVETFVEKTLERSGPGSAFPGAVLAVLPLSAGSPAAAGAGVAKGAGAAKSGFMAALLAPLVPFAGIVAVAIAQLFVIRSSETSRQRRLKAAAISLASMLVVLATAWGGEIATGFLCQRFEWSDPVSFAAKATYWWFYCGVLCTLMAISRPFTAVMRRQTPAAVEAPAETRSKKRAYAAFASAMLLTVFWWPLRVAWHFQDYTSVATMVAGVAALSLWTARRIARSNFSAVGQAMAGGFGLAAVLALAVCNLRLDVWMAAERGVSVAQIHETFPIWIIPALSLAFFVWVWCANALAPRREIKPPPAS